MMLLHDNIEGVFLTELRQISDNRGSVLHMLRNDSPGFVRFGECYFSEIMPGMVKAWKRHHIQTQNIAVPVGQIRMVIYDDRGSSRTQGQIQVIELSRPTAYFRLQIPPKVWYGFRCLSSSAALLVNCADMPHDPAESDIISSENSGIPYRWDENKLV